MKALSGRRSVLGPALALLVASGASSCGGAEPRRFPLRDPIWVDDDLRPVSVPCREVEDDGEKVLHCRPKEYVSPFAWDVADKTIFRPVSQFFAMDFGFKAKNVNAMDEVPDSSWFTNRIGVRPFTAAEITRGSCPEIMLDPVKDADGSWVIDQGKPNGANPGFRVNIKGVGKFMLKADQAREGEKATGSTAIASRLYHAAGWYVACDTVVYLPKRLLSLKPGLKFADNSGVERDFDQPAMEKILDGAQKRDGLYRMLASRWLEGRTIGPFKYEETRADDPNDVVDHEDRRDLRGARLIAAWLGHFDSREQNSMTTWHSVDKNDKDGSPGYTLHWYIDLGDCFGSHWEWDSLNRRINKSYYFDPAHVATDLLTLGTIKRPWDEGKIVKGAEMFAYFPLDDFDPEAWKGGYPNPAFQRMDEGDAAWAARILTRFTDEHIKTAVDVGDYTDPFHREVLTKALIKRRNKIRERFFAKLAPVSDVRVSGAKVCATDLARQGRTWPDTAFKYTAAIYTGRMLDKKAPLAVTPSANGELCLEMPKVAPSDSKKDDDPERYAVVDVLNGVAEGPLRMHFYDLGAKGFKLVGLERPKDADPDW